MKHIIILFMILFFSTSCKLSQSDLQKRNGSLDSYSSEGGENGGEGEGEGEGDSNEGSEHANVTSNCIRCHSNTRRPNISQHNSGQDCSMCHTVSNNGNGLSWRNVIGSGGVHPSANANCIGCHQSAMPAFAPHLPGQLGSSNNCSTCHTYPSFATLHFSHTSSLTTCSECHDNGRMPSLLIQRPSGHPSVNYVKLECAKCHQNPNNAATWGATVIFNHHNHSPTPTNCKICH